MDEFVQLKCKSCGAPLDADSGSDTITCPCCGSIQQRVDSKKYLEQVKGEMMAWLSKAIPSGVNISSTESMDPIARHNIFVNSVEHSVENELGNYRFGLFSLLANPLVLMPHECYNGVRVKHDSKKVFEFDAKVKSVSQLAVDDESKNLLSLCSAISVVYASVINSVNLFNSDVEGRYHFVTNNLNQSAAALENLEEFKLIRERFLALALLSDGITDILDGRAAFGRTKISEAKERLTEVSKTILLNVDYSLTYKGILGEIAVCDSMSSIAAAVAENPALNPQSVVEVANNMVIEMEREELFVSGVWDMQLKRSDRKTEIFKQLGEVLSAKSGQRKFRIAKGEGNYYLPMWAMEITYSFVTGALFKKRAVEVKETILLSSGFITSPLDMKKYSRAVTDIFGSIPETTFFQRVKGEEKSISMGGCVKELYDGSVTSPLPDNARCVVPMCTQREAELFCNNYLSESKALHPKLSMGKAVARELIFVPCVMDEKTCRLNVKLGNMAPASVGDPAALIKISI